ncbi:MAG: hypothetical protein IJ705_01095 [Oscillospiraceae bacterium]|nr:hypothetical protein [Oscillospiraceae bacterium]
MPKGVQVRVLLPAQSASAIWLGRFVQEIQLIAVFLPELFQFPDGVRLQRKRRFRIVECFLHPAVARRLLIDAPLRFARDAESISEIAMYHMMKESAIEKAKNRALKKLREACPKIQAATRKRGKFR